MCAGNRIGAAGAASLALSLGGMTQLTMLDLRGMLRASAGSCAVSGCLRMPAVHGWCCVLWAEAVVRGAGAGGGVCEARAEGRRCVQTMGSEQQHQQHQQQQQQQQQKLQLQQKKLQLLQQLQLLQLQLLMLRLRLLLLLLMLMLMLGRR